MPESMPREIHTPDIIKANLEDKLRTASRAGDLLFKEKKHQPQHREEKK